MKKTPNTGGQTRQRGEGRGGPEGVQSCGMYGGDNSLRLFQISAFDLQKEDAKKRPNANRGVGPQPKLMHRTFAFSGAPLL